MGSLGLQELIIVIPIILPFYFIPSIAARKKTDFRSIFFLNIFLGWTIIGWIIALFWALKKGKR